MDFSWDVWIEIEGTVLSGTVGSSLFNIDVTCWLGKESCLYVWLAESCWGDMIDWDTSRRFYFGGVVDFIQRAVFEFQYGKIVTSEGYLTFVHWFLFEFLWIPVTTADSEKRFVTSMLGLKGSFCEGTKVFRATLLLSMVVTSFSWLNEGGK